MCMRMCACMCMCACVCTRVGVSYSTAHAHQSGVVMPQSHLYSDQSSQDQSSKDREKEAESKQVVHHEHLTTGGGGRKEKAVHLIRQPHCVCICVTNRMNFSRIKATVTHTHKLCTTIHYNTAIKKNIPIHRLCSMHLAVSGH